MDGGSTDDTAQVIKKNADIVTIFKSEKDYNGTHALNKGILISRGRYIMNMNDDDYMYPDGVRIAVNTMENNPEIDALIFGGEYYRFDPVSGLESLVGYQYLPTSRTLVSDVRNFFYFTTAGFLILRKQTIARVGLFDANIQASDTEYCSRLLLSNVNFKYLNIKLFKHIARPESSQNINAQEGRRDLIRIAIRHKIWDEVMKHQWSEIRNVLGLSQCPYEILNLFFHITIHRLHLILLNQLRKLKPILKRFSLLSFLKYLINYKLKLQTPVEPQWDGSLR
jgi:glycosyltransferase involved in cell wall biosynthesis